MIENDGNEIAVQDLLNQQYLHLEKGETSYCDMVGRVAKYIGAGKEVMTDKKFLPNSPTLMNAGREGRMAQLSACFVLPIDDTIESIFGTLGDAALIHKTGGGTGFSFSSLRPSGDVVGSTKGVSSGVVSFMKIYDTATEQIKQGGMRRGANMGVLRVDHPDIQQFIRCKARDGLISNFNLSVGLTDDFLKAVGDRENFELINPRNGEGFGEVYAPELFDQIVYGAWKNGEPGVLFLDEINRRNPTPELGQIEATNPCGEQPLLPYESCNLGSINLSEHVDEKRGGFDYGMLSDTIEEALLFMNKVIDLNNFPLPQIKEMTLKNRKIGLGVMGWADALIKLGVRYDSVEALDIAEDVMGFIQMESHSLAEDKGYGNKTITTIAPTGSISMLAGCSSGIEPIFSVFERRKHHKIEYVRVHPLFGKGYDEEDFRTAHQVDWTWHLAHQETFQKHTDNAISKTINMPADTRIEEVREAVLSAWMHGLKGVTVYRDGSRDHQVISAESRCANGNCE